VDEVVAAPNFAPAFDLAPRIPPPARVAGVQPRGRKTHQQAAPVKKGGIAGRNPAGGQGDVGKCLMLCCFSNTLVYILMLVSGRPWPT
jgi:hypothetical protein